MPSPTSDVARLVKAARVAVADVSARAHLARAWELLHTRDADGNLTDARPYTDAAIRELQAAAEQSPDDPRVLHHLAVAEHARAWDLELEGHPRAVKAWTDALGHWRNVATSAAFWAGLEDKLRSCDAAADAAFLQDARRNLLEHLLDVHVDFVRHYCEGGETGQAAKHVGIIKAARIPPALRTRLTDKVFDAMTTAVPEAKAQGAFAPAVKAIQRFLVLFPTHLPALTMALELCAGWVGGLSYRNDWDAIEEVHRTAEPFARQTAVHAEVGQDVRARTALESLADEMVQRGYDRTCAFLQGREYADLSQDERRELRSGLELALAWGRLAAPHSPAGSRLRQMFLISLQNFGWFQVQEQREVEAADIDEPTRVSTCVELLREAVAATQEGLTLAPDHEVLLKNREGLKKMLAWWEGRQRLQSGGDFDWQSSLEDL